MVAAGNLVLARANNSCICLWMASPGSLLLFSPIWNKTLDGIVDGLVLLMMSMI